MPREKRSTYTDQQKPQAGGNETGHERKEVARRETGARAWATVNKLNSTGKKLGTGRKVPSGPVGGSGRKTNLSRSS